MKFLGVNYNFILILFYCSFFYNTNIPIIKKMGFIAITFLLLLGISTFIKSFKKINKFSLISFFLILIYNFIRLILDYNSLGLYYFFMQFAVLSYILALTTQKKTNFQLNLISSKLSILYYLTIIAYYIILFIVKDTLDYLWMLSIAFALQFFVLYRSKKWFWVILLSFVTFIIAKERTLAIMTLIVYILFKLPISEKKGSFYILFWICILFVLVFPYIYTFLAYGESLEINDYIYKYSGKNFFSGRQVIWGIIIENLTNSPYIGYGLGNNILFENGIEVSTHNLFLFLSLQGGVISVFLFISFLYSLYRQYVVDSKSVKLSHSYFIAIILSSSFGLILLANFLLYSMFLWLIIGYGIMETNIYKINE